MASSKDVHEFALLFLGSQEVLSSFCTLSRFSKSWNNVWSKECLCLLFDLLLWWKGRKYTLDTITGDWGDNIHFEDDVCMWRMRAADASKPVHNRRLDTTVTENEFVLCSKLNESTHHWSLAFDGAPNRLSPTSFVPPLPHRTFMWTSSKERVVVDRRTRFDR